MLRSFGVVGALAAAALALVIGILAFNAHSNSDQHPPPAAGGPQSGNADHPSVVAELRKYLPAALGGANGQEYTPPAAPPPAAESQPTVTVRATSAGGGGAPAAAPPRAAAACSPGLVGSLLAVVGSLLGGGGSPC
ncbi:MAG TPA: hypothetical protein VGM60_13700 [Pseudonocardia sp.]|uniref:hypothetical protein n=1 Tax=Pseudonocardia sp. TaxID=60912 RepID=UPI002F3E89F3